MCTVISFFKCINFFLKVSVSIVLIITNNPFIRLYTKTNYAEKQQ